MRARRGLGKIVIWYSLEIQLNYGCRACVCVFFCFGWFGVGGFKIVVQGHAMNTYLTLNF